jgi:hypothetical protein
LIVIKKKYNKAQIVVAIPIVNGLEKIVFILTIYINLMRFFSFLV